MAHNKIMNIDITFTVSLPSSAWIAKFRKYTTQRDEDLVNIAW